MPRSDAEAGAGDAAVTLAADRCPGLLALTPARDGLMARLRLPGGILSPGALRAVIAATAMGDGCLDLTARANLQLRGLTPGILPALTGILAAAGLLPAPRHDRVRNILASPLAGLDPTEQIDLRPAVAALDRALCAAPDLADLPPKFGFVLDGGGLAVAGFAHDVGFAATRPGGAGFAAIRPESAGSEPALALLLAGQDSGWRLAVDAVPALAVAAARGFLARRAWRGTEGGASAHIADLPPRMQADLLHDLVATGLLTPRIGLALPVGRADFRGPLGVLAQRQAGRVALAPVVPLGRLTAAHLALLADLVDGGGELRLTPWRGVILPDLPQAGLPQTLRRLAAAGLVVDEAAPFAGLVACSGQGGCDRALADVRADAAAFARRRGRGGRPVQWFGCAKRCAGAADQIAVVAEAGGYALWDGTGWRARDLSPADAAARLETMV